MILTGTSLTHLYILYMNIFLLLLLLNIMNLKQKIIFLLLYMSPNNSTYSNYFECEECQYHQKLCVMPVNARKNPVENHNSVHLDLPTVLIFFPIKKFFCQVMFVVLCFVLENYNTSSTLSWST